MASRHRSTFWRPRTRWSRRAPTPLPEAQLDRFLLQVDVGYPDMEAERRMLIATTGADEERAEAVLTAKELLDAQALLRRLPVGQSVVDAILGIVRAGRLETTTLDDVTRHVAWGPVPAPPRR